MADAINGIDSRSIRNGLRIGGAALAALAFVAFAGFAMRGSDIEMDISEEFAAHAAKGNLTAKDYCNALNGLKTALDSYIEDQGGAEAVPNVQTLCLPLAFPR